MDHKILFVDDEQSVLNAIQRMLGFDFNISAANSATDALDMMDSHGPFSVVFTDMRMPGMDGLAFLKHAHMVAPDSIYVMLTGNNDQTTAVNAVNEGKVFRFLNKPCQKEMLESVIQASIRQFELVNHEKFLLDNTFAGAVKMLTDIIQVSRPSLGRLTSEIENKVRRINQAMKHPERWEFRVAARLSLVGVSLIDDRDDDSVLDVRTSFDSKVDSINESNAIGSRLVSKIPRLEEVTGILRDSSKSTGVIEPQNTDESAYVIASGAAMLRIAMLWQLLEDIEDDANDILRKLMVYCPDIPNEIRSLILSTSKNQLVTTPTNMLNNPALFETDFESTELADADQVEVDTLALRKGMITAEEIVSDGVLLVKSGRALTTAMVEHLRSIRKIQTVKIIKGSQKGAALVG